MRIPDFTRLSTTRLLAFGIVLVGTVVVSWGWMAKSGGGVGRENREVKFSNPSDAGSEADVRRVENGRADEAEPVAGATEAGNSANRGPGAKVAWAGRAAEQHQAGNARPWGGLATAAGGSPVRAEQSGPGSSTRLAASEYGGVYRQSGTGLAGIGAAGSTGLTGASSQAAAGTILNGGEGGNAISQTPSVSGGLGAGVMNGSNGTGSGTGGNAMAGDGSGTSNVPAAEMPTLRGPVAIYLEANDLSALSPAERQAVTDSVAAFDDYMASAPTSDPRDPVYARYWRMATQKSDSIMRSVLGWSGFDAMAAQVVDMKPGEVGL